MNTYLNSQALPRGLRRVYGEVVADHAATASQAARLAALGVADGVRSEAPAPLWDGGLLDRLTVPLSRLRE